MAEQVSTPLSICLSDPQRRDEAAAQEGAQNSERRQSFWDHGLRVSVHASHEALTLLARWECYSMVRVEGEGELLL